MSELPPAAVGRRFRPLPEFSGAGRLTMPREA